MKIYHCGRNVLYKSQKNSVIGDISGVYGIDKLDPEFKYILSLRSILRGGDKDKEIILPHADDSLQVKLAQIKANLAFVLSIPEKNIRLGDFKQLSASNERESYAVTPYYFEQDYVVKNIVYVEKGVIQLEIEFYGLAAHSSRPWLGENAIDNAFKFYDLLKKYLIDEKKLHMDNSYWTETVSLNVIEGGTATNIIPSKVLAKFDIRYTENTSQEEILNIVNSFLGKTNGKIQRILKGSLLYTDPNLEEVQKYFKIAKTYIPGVSLAKEHGSSDGRFFAEKGAKVLLHRPRCGNVHGKGEYVIFEDMEVIYNVYKDFILS